MVGAVVTWARPEMAAPHNALAAASNSGNLLLRIIE
jgi:hypothetical protein